MNNSFTDAYEKILCRPPADVAETEGNFPDVSSPSAAAEADLQAWWAAVPPGSRFTSREGHRLEVHHPGRKNTGPGPDFTHAQIGFNGEIIRGSVEIHRHAGGWTAHGHHTDPRYNDVILHVIPETDPSPGTVHTRTGRCVATLRLPVRRAGAEEDLPLVPAPLPARCRDIYGDEPSAMAGLLWLAASWRILQKARALAERAAAAGMEQALYERIMVACGWGGNEALMEALARAVPCERLRQMARQHHRLPEAALFHMAGLFPESPPDNDPDTLAYWTELRGLKEQYLPGLKRLRDAPFPVRGRPMNRPERRLAAAARIIVRTAVHGVEDTLLKPWYAIPANSALQTARQLVALFEVRHGFWESRCGWTGKPLSRPVALLGSDRALSMAGNIAIPLALAHARVRGSVNLERRIAECLRNFPAESDSAPLKWMRERIFAGHYPFKPGFAMQQGLLQLYRDWCGFNLTCEDCPVPSALKRLPDGLPREAQSR